MADVLVDSSVIIDVLKRDPMWFAWSSTQLIDASGLGDALVNQVIYAEVLAGFRADIPDSPQWERFIRRDLPWQAAELAGRAHREYRRRGGARDAILPDFLIGAHAAVEGLSLLTRDPRRIRTAFPGVALITPEQV